MPQFINYKVQRLTNCEQKIGQVKNDRREVTEQNALRIVGGLLIVQLTLLVPHD